MPTNNEIRLETLGTYFNDVLNSFRRGLISESDCYRYCLPFLEAEGYPMAKGYIIVKAAIERIRKEWWHQEQEAKGQKER